MSKRNFTRIFILILNFHFWFTSTPSKNKNLKSSQEDSCENLKPQGILKDICRTSWGNLKLGRKYRKSQRKSKGQRKEVPSISQNLKTSFRCPLDFLCEFLFLIVRVSKILKMSRRCPYDVLKMPPVARTIRFMASRPEKYPGGRSF